MPGDFVCTSANDGTHLFRPVSARGHTFWHKQNFNKFVVDNGTSVLNRGNSVGDILDIRGLNTSQFKVSTPSVTITPNITASGNLEILGNISGSATSTGSHA